MVNPVMEKYIYSPDMERITVDKNELSRRLKADADFCNSTMEKYIELVKKESNAKCCFTICNVRAEDALVEFDFATFETGDLAKCLSGCKRACAMGATLGISVDRLIQRSMALSKAEGFIIDSVASALMEAVMDDFNGELKKKFKLTPRFSPGYGDFVLSSQEHILSALKADKILGIKLGRSLLMTPKKSITDSVLRWIK